MLRIFQDTDNEYVVRARDKLNEELARLETLKTPQERVKDLDDKLSQVRNVVGLKSLELARAQQQAQEAQNRVNRLDDELQASLAEARRLEVQQDQYKSQMPYSDSLPTQAAQEESPEERQCANTIDFLVQHGGDTAHVQQTLNELQDKYLRLGAERRRSRAVQEDLLEHGLSETPPWPLQEGSQVREVVVTQGSLATQRHVLDFCTSKSKGKGSKTAASSTGKGKGPERDVHMDTHARTPPAATPSASSASSDPSTRRPTATPTAPKPPTATSTEQPPWRDQAPPSRETAPTAPAASTDMADEDGPERGYKRPAEPTHSEATQNQDEEDEFQEAARYRRGDGHLT
jgi:hypothetical protein